MLTREMDTATRLLVLRQVKFEIADAAKWIQADITFSYHEGNDALAFVF